MTDIIPVKTVNLWMDEYPVISSELRPVILGMVSKESSFNPKAPRFEALYPWVENVDHHAKVLGISRETEIACQRFSYGLLQIMGANCRTQGYHGYLFDLTVEHQKAFDFGLWYFFSQLKRYNQNVEKALSAYNRGYASVIDGKLNGADYANDVLIRSEKFV